MGTLACLNCAQALAETEPRWNNGGKAGPSARCELETEDDITFYRCPRCKAKNIVAEARTPSGYPQVAIVSFRLP